jgi:hypothetical protein
MLYKAHDKYMLYKARSKKVFERGQQQSADPDFLLVFLLCSIFLHSRFLSVVPYPVYIRANFATKDTDNGTAKYFRAKFTHTSVYLKS